MSVRFSIAKRKCLPSEGREWALYPRLKSGSTTNVVEFLHRSKTWKSLLSHNALGEAQRIMLHELENGHAVALPGIGTFRLNLKGNIRSVNGTLRGDGVSVGGILFQPDRELLEAVRALEVNQDSVGQAYHVDDGEAEQVLTELFAKSETISRKDIYLSRMGLTKHRATTLLKRLVSEGRLKAEGRGPQTRYRAAEGQFVRRD